MLNVLVKGKRVGFVLIRALEPINGIEEMKKARANAGSETTLLRTGKIDEGARGERHPPWQ